MSALTSRGVLLPLAAGPSLTRQAAPAGCDERVWRALEDAAVQGGRTLQEVLEACGEDAEGVESVWAERLLDLGGPILPYRYRGRYRYDWAVLALAPGPIPAELVRALRQADPRKSGLVLAHAAPAGSASEHVDVLTRESAEGEELTFERFVELARSLLRFLPPLRLFLAGADSLERLADRLEGHTLGLGFHPGETSAKPLVRRARAAVGLDASASIARYLTPGSLVLPAPEAPDEAEVRWRSCVLGAPRPPASHRAIFACLHLLGDLVNVTQSLREYRRRNPGHHVTLIVPDRGYARVMEFSEEIDELVYVSGRAHRAIVYESSTQHASSLMPFQEPAAFRHAFDIQVTPRRDAEGRTLHMAETYARALGYTLASTKPLLARERALRVEAVTPDAPYVVFARHTVSGAHFDPKHASTKRWPERRWKQLARRVRTELGLCVVSIGTREEAPLAAPGVLDLHELDIRAVGRLLAGARALVCIDNGVFHVGLALDVPVVHLHPAWLPLEWTRSPENVPHRDIHRQMNRIGTADVFDALAELLAEGRAIDGHPRG